MTSDNNIISLDNIASMVNSANLNDEIVVYDQRVVNCVTSSPARLDCMLIMLVVGGEGRIGIDLKEYDVRKNSLIFIQPRNYVYFKQKSGDFQMHIVACSQHIVEDVLPKLTDLLPLLIHHRTEPVNDLSDDEARGIDSFYNFLKAKLEGAPTPFLKHKVLCILQAALFEMMDIVNSSEKLSGMRKSRKEEIMAKFIILVSEHFRTHRNLTFYSDKLCITPKHLSSVVKEISGRSAGDWIDNYVIMESKVLLKTTDMTIQEISAKLNFANQSFFGKYFKHLTGSTPTQYRKINS